MWEFGVSGMPSTPIYHREDWAQATTQIAFAAGTTWD